jgi:hypothetical protein
MIIAAGASLAPGVALAATPSSPTPNPVCGTQDTAREVQTIAISTFFGFGIGAITFNARGRNGGNPNPR